MMTIYDLIAVFLVLTATFAWINHRLIRLPHTIGLLVMGLVASLGRTGARGHGADRAERAGQTV